MIRKACEMSLRSRSTAPPRTVVEEQERGGRAAQSRVQRGQVSRARQELTGAQLAPRDESTLEELRRRRPQERIREIPAEVLDFIPEGELQLDSLSVCAVHLLEVLLDLVDVPMRFCVCVWTTGTHYCYSRRLPKISHALPFLWTFPGVHDRHHDCSQKARRWSPRHCHWCSVPTISRQDSGETVWRRRRGSMFPFPVCPFHTRRSGLCGTCGASHDRRRPSCHGVVGRRDWCIRPCAPRVNDVQIVGSYRVARVVAIRQSFIQVTFAVHLGGRSRTEPRDSATRRRRRRPFECRCCVALPSTTVWRR